VVGGGPTGVELAGALGEIGLHTLAREFRRIDPTRVRVLLLEGRDRVLSGYAPRLSEAAARSLARRRVEVRTGCTVTDIDPQGVTYRTAAGATERVEARTVIWAAGVQGSPLARSLGAPLDRAGRVQVLPDLSIPGHPEVFVVGDLAAGGPPERPWPGVAQHAMQGGRYVAGVIAAEARRGPGGARRPYRYRDKGSMATVGRASAVVETRRVGLSGFWAWLLWWVVHVVYLVGYRSRVFVLLSWAWSFVTFSRGSRLITGGMPPLPAITDVKPDGTLAMPSAAGAVELPAADAGR
jgi:NADH dehydrogenase